MADSFEIELELTYIEFLYAMFYMIPKMKMVKRIFIITCGIGVFNGIMSVVAYGKIPPEWYSIVFQVLALPVFILLFFAVMICILSGILMMLKPNQFKNISYHFTHWGMEKTGTDINFSRQWSKFLKYRQTKRFILLYVSENDAHIVQKRKFQSQEDLQDFITLISKNIKS